MTPVFAQRLRPLARRRPPGRRIPGCAALGRPRPRPPPTPSGPASRRPRAAATSSKPETVEQRITTLKTALKITPDQESKWDGVAKAMRENAAAMDKLVQEKQGKMANMNAVDDLKTYQDFSQAHLDGLKNLTSAFKTLYNSMPADQKKNADQRVRQLRSEAGAAAARRSRHDQPHHPGDRPRARRFRRSRHARQRPLVRRRPLARRRSLAATTTTRYYGYHYRAPPVVYAHAVQLRLLRAAGDLRQHAWLHDPNSVVRRNDRIRRA